MSIFTKVKGFRAKKNAFNLSHQIAQTQDIGQIMPCYLHDGILPGSKEVLNATSVVRFQAMLAPLQHKVDLYAHFWFVPYRIIDKQFTHFISGDMMRNNETYDCPVISLSRVAKLMYYLPYAQVGEVPGLVTVNEFLKLLMNPSGLLVYLNYPSLNPDVEAAIYNFDTTTGSFPSTPDLIEFNVKRLQAYFYVIAQNYVNENFTQKYQFTSGSTYVIDLIQELFNFALGDFELLNNPEDSVAKTKVGARNEEVCLAKILLSLYYRGLDLRRMSQGRLNPNFSFPHAWKKDYFTSALPFVQLGDEVTVPISSGPANFTNLNLQASARLGNGVISVYPQNNEATATLQVDGTSHQIHEAYSNPGQSPSFEKVEGLEGELNIEDGDGYANVDLEAAITINELRAANALQSLKEGFARFGTRFQEWLKGFWNVNSSDRSQQLPEWLGGYRVPVQISEIEQTSATESSELKDATSPLGTLAGKGLGIGGKRVFKRYFEEPGVVIGLCFLQPKAVYPTTGVDRFLLKTNNLFDYFTPKMEHLGEQSVYSGELFMSADNDRNMKTFGYQSRYAEYKQIQSKYRGQFADVLNFWHLGRDFKNQPILGNAFIYIDNATMRRPFAVQQIIQEPLPGVQETIDISSAMLWFNFDVKYIAPMSRFGTPALLN